MALKLDSRVDTLLPFPIVALALVDSRIFWGDSKGQIGVLDTSAAVCREMSARATLLGNIEVARLVPRSDASMVFFAVGGSVYESAADQTLGLYAAVESCHDPLAPDGSAR